MNRYLVVFLSGIIFFLACSNQKAEHADLVLINGKVWTGDPVNFAEAVAIRENRIVGVGTTRELQKVVGEQTRVIDVNGKLVTPGFNDAHIHFLGGSIGLSEVELASAENLSEVAQRIMDFAKANPGREWITGRGWQYTFFPGGMPTKKFLDTLGIDRPIYLRAYDGHSALANSKALSLAGIDRAFRFSGFGEVIRDAKGEPTGALTEHAQGLVSKRIPSLTREEKLDALRQGMKLAASLGITSIQNASGSEDEFSLYEELLNSGALTIRSSTAFSVGPNTTPEDISSYSEIRDRFRNNSFLRAGAVKFMLDGVIESHTAAMIEPYSNADTKGMLSMPVDRYRELVRQFDKAGFQIYTHAIGDLAVREALNAYESVTEVNGTTGKRHRVEHIETVSPDDIPRFAKLGVLPGMQPIHPEPGTIQIWADAVGQDRLPYSFPWASLLRSNATLVFSSDWPACISIDPLYGLHVAITRCTPDGTPPGGWIPEQRISVNDALLAYTLGGAYASFDENEKGKIAPGFLADIIVLSQDLFLIDPLKTYDTRVELTVFDGNVIYEDTAAINNPL